eukprot:GHUV01002832.1.p1 GENE.GHUV01002832.1~~GHUV01002832.1.p1  ORF type:complete len:359 (+),score=140.60 GHUV01002832.1:154-1230(+)
MVRQLTLQAVIPGCTTKEFYQMACSDSKAITRFHLDVNKDDTVTVSEWEADKMSRVLTYTLDMAIPAALKRFVGTEPIRIKEKQICEWSDEQTLKITSIPILQISMAKSLSTEAVLYITTTSEGCQIDVTVTVSATVPWPLQSTVESLMADEAKQTVGKYVDYISKYVEEALTEMNNLALLQQQELEQGLAELAEQDRELATEAAGQAAIAVAQQQQQQLATITPPKQHPEHLAAPIQVLATSATPVEQGRLQVAAPAAADTDVFYDAQEATSADLVLQALLKELRQAKQDRHEANRLLVSIKDSLQQMERTILKEAAFQEGVRYGQRLGTGSLLLSVTAAAAAASAVTAFVLMRRSR